MNKISMLLGLAIISLNASAANPTVKNNVATYSGNITLTQNSSANNKGLSKNTYVVPDTWTKIIIDKNTTIKGNFLIRGASDRKFEIVGNDRATSIIDGSVTPFVKGDRSRCNIRVDNKGSIKISNLTSKNSANFHLTGFSSAEINNVSIIQPNKQHSVDGIHFGGGAKISNSYISIHDDAMYVGETYDVFNCTIVHNKNGSPCMISWGASADGKKTKFSKVKFLANETGGKDYNHGVIGWSQKHGTKQETATVEFVNCEWKANPGKKVSDYFYSFGRWCSPKSTAARDKVKVINATIVQVGGLCGWADKVLRRSNLIQGVRYTSTGSIVKPSTCAKKVMGLDIEEDLEPMSKTRNTSNTLSILPSIASGNQTLELHLPFGIETEPADIEIFNASGQSVQSFRFCNDFGQNIKLDNLKSGVHIVVASVGGEKYSTRLIIK